jgi:hypothetical protein
MSHAKTSRMFQLTVGALLSTTTVCAIIALAACTAQTGHEPSEDIDQASSGTCPVTITVPTAGEAVGGSIQISVTQSCKSWTNAMIAYIDGQRCDEAPYPYPNAGCTTTAGAQNFSTSTWIQVSPGKHTLNVNNWNSTGTVGESTSVTFTYGAVEAGPPPVPNLDNYMHDTNGPGTADVCTTANGYTYCGGSCTGACADKPGSPSSTYSITTGITNPQEDGSSTRVNVSGPSTDTLQWVKIDPAAQGSGKHNDDTHFEWDFYFYPTATDKVQAYEFDAFQAANGYELMMGSQCDLVTKNWNGWGQNSSGVTTWLTSGVTDCNALFKLNQWNHIVITYHRDPGTIGKSTRYYYDSLVDNGVPQAWGLSSAGYLPVYKPTWRDVVGVQVQQDLTSSFSGTLSSYYDGFNFTMSE